MSASVSAVAFDAEFLQFSSRGSKDDVNARTKSRLVLTIDGGAQIDLAAILALVGGRVEVTLKFSPTPVPAINGSADELRRRLKLHEPRPREG